MPTNCPLTLLSASIVAASCTLASAADSHKTIELHGGVLEMPRMSVTVLSEELAAFATEGETQHAIVHLHAELDAMQRLAIAGQGIELHSCLGARTWIAAIGADVAGNAGLFADRIAWVGPLTVREKLHPYLAAGNVPEWTVARGDLDAFLEGRSFDPAGMLEQLDAAGDPVIAVYMLAHKDVDLMHFAGILPQALSVEVRSKMPSVNGLVLRIPMSEVGALAALEQVLWVEPALPPLVTNNAENRANTGVDQVMEAPYNLSGQGVSVIVYDGGSADASHPDFGGRVMVRDSSGLSTHATHVCGTVGGDGANSGGQNAGMAPAASIQSYGFEQEGGLSEGFLYTDPGDFEQDYGDAILNWGAVVANNSIGTNTASNGFDCEWTGNYGVMSSLIDAAVRGSLGGDIRIVWSAGNERQTSRCGDLYYTTAPPACAKNHITVGALNADDDSMTYFSSWGPADDGRLKPDVTGPGCQSNGDGGVTSTFPGGGYGVYCGTSMSGPTVTGIAALVIEQWRLLYPEAEDIPNSALKALLANTGDDLGNVGPDCLYGFGTVRANKAIDSLRDEGIFVGECGDGQVTEHLVLVADGDDELRITLAWDDEPASPLPVSALVNDLDLVVTSPSGDRVYPWTIDPADPGAPATRSGEDRWNNMEQVSVSGPVPGAWRVQIVGHSVPVGPQEYSLAATPSPLSCSSTGVAGFGGVAFQPDTLVTMTVVDCDLNVDDEAIDSVDVLVYSDDDPTGMVVTLIEEDPLAAAFSGSVQLASTEGSGTLFALDGSEITLEYLDAMDTDGNQDVLVMDTARVDGSVQPPTDVSVPEFSSDSATVRVVTEEPVRVRIMYGLSCDALNDEVSGGGYSTDQEVVIGGLEDTYTYYFRIELTDQAGNTVESGDGDGCWEFTVPDALDYYAEQFSSGIDLLGMSTTFAPIASADFFIPCTQEITALPVDPSGGTVISLSDDDSASVSLPFTFPYYGETWNSLYVGSNGYVTFDGPSTTYSESFSEHFNYVRIAAIFDDFNPSAGGTVSVKDTGSSFAITWENVPEYSTSNANTFQIVIEPSGQVTLAWTQIATVDGIVGLSPGGGQDPGFIPNDLSESTIGCVPRPPSASSVTVSTSPGTPVDITLQASDDGEPGPFVYVIESLPNFTLRDASTGEVINDVPYVMPSTDGPHLVYEPAGSWEGATSFLYHADDGGTPPEGGPSNTAEVSIAVTVGPTTVYAFMMDEDPNWTLEGDWAFGQPTGGGGQYGNPDPTSGATGANVLGYNLDGDYPNSMPEYSATTDSLDCSEMTDVSLRFMRWLNVEQPVYDHARIQVSIAGGVFQTIWENTIEVTDSAWTQEEYDISSLADGQSDVRIRWVMGTSDSGWTYSGWNLDDVEVRGIVPPTGNSPDINGDGVVDGADLTIVLGSWGICVGCPADLNGDGVVDGADLTIVLGAWGTGGFLASHDEGASRGEETGFASGAPEDLRPLVNDGRIAPRESGGILVASNGYVQLENGLLDIELAGPLPVVEHDLVLVTGDAVLGGTLMVRFTGEDDPEGTIHVLLLADRIIDAFHDVQFIGAHGEGLHTCITQRALIVQREGPLPGKVLDEPAFPVEALELIDAIGAVDPAWDLNGDGLVTFEDLGLLLRDGVDCR